MIKQGLLVDGSITAYDAGVDGWEDEFLKMLLTSDIKDKLIKKDTTFTEDLDDRVNWWRNTRRWRPRARISVATA